MNYFAYIDPGTGSLIIQGVIAAVAGVGIFFKDSIKRVVLTVKNRLSRKPQK